MAAIILGNVSIQGVSFASGDIGNYVLTSTGAGDTIKGEQNLIFDGTTLGITGNETVSGTLVVTGATTLNSTLSVPSLAAGVTVNVLNYNDSTGAVTYNASGGGTDNFLRADGTWVSVGAAGSSGEIQFNDSTAFGGSSDLYWDDTNSVLIMGGGTTYISVDPQLVVGRTADAVGNGHCFVDESIINKSDSPSAIGYNSFDHRIYIQGTYDYDHTSGFQAAPEMDGSGTINKMIGHSFAPSISDGVVTNAYGYKMNNFLDSGGTVTNYYGLYSDETIDSATNNYFLYSGGATDSYLGGDLELGGTIKIGSVPTYADNTAAKAGGLVDDEIYRTSTGILMIVYT